ncbi:MAG: DUF1328 domain-containing protein [Gammaproteobacteria bacterium]
MLQWALIFFIISIVAAIFGFTGVAATTATIAKVIFIVYVSLFVITLILYFTKIRLSMLGWLIVFFVAALISGLLAFTGTAAAIVEIAKVVFYIFLILCIASFTIHFMRKPKQL